MGQSMSWLSSLLWAKKEIRILILGLVRTVMPQGMTRVADDVVCRTMPARQHFCIDSRFAPRFPSRHVRLLATSPLTQSADRRGGDNDSNYRFQR